MTKSNFFTGVSTLTELKINYKKLAMVWHPDKGGCTETMKAINNEYDSLFNILKDSYNKAAVEQSTHEMHEVPEQYREIIVALMNLGGIEIELTGSWIWISGNTKEVKAELKELGCMWAHKKLLWYWRPEEFKSYSRKSASMSDIRNKYGSEKIVNNTKSLK